MRHTTRRQDRGFTLVELMLVVGIIGVIASLAIPNYLRFTARTTRSEMLETVSKMKLSFKNVFDNTGSFVTSSTAAAGVQSGINPTAAVVAGQAASWNPLAPGWTEFQFPPEGAVKMRYWYKIMPGGQDVFITVCGSFAGLGGATVTCPADLTGTANYRYDELFHGNGASEVPTENPAF